MRVNSIVNDITSFCHKHLGKKFYNQQIQLLDLKRVCFEAIPQRLFLNNYFLFWVLMHCYQSHLHIFEPICPICFSKSQMELLPLNGQKGKIFFKHDFFVKF